MLVLSTSIPLYALLTGLLAPIPIWFSHQRSNEWGVWAVVAAVLMFGMVFSLVPMLLDGSVVDLALLDLLPGVGIAFKIDPLGLLFGIVASFLWILTTFYSFGYLKATKEEGQPRFHCFFALSLAATLGVAFAGNLLTLYLFYELLSFATYPLVTHHGGEEARMAGRRYLIHLLGLSILLLLPAMILVYTYTGSLDFQSGGLLGGAVSKSVGGCLLFMFIFGFGKAGLMPFHTWLPGAMVAPTPVSALLHAVAVVKVGVFCIIRAVTGIVGTDYVREILVAGIPLQTVACIIVSITVIGASLIALSQDNLKRRLAFSTIGQLGYIVLGVLLLAPKAIIGATMHIAMHAFSKITLFFCAGAIYVATGKKYVSELDGIGWRMPFTMGAFLIGAMGVVGLPPTSGFVSKWVLLQGAWEGDQFIFAGVYLVSSFLSAAYLLPIVFKAFLRTDEGSVIEVKEAPGLCVVPLVITAIFTVLLFFLGGRIYNFLGLV